MFHRRRPIVSARSAKDGPKLLVLRAYVPREESNVYVKPPEDEPNGKVASWDAIA